MLTRNRVLALAVLLAVALTACGKTGKDDRPDGGDADIAGKGVTFRIPLDQYHSRYWTVDSQGNTVEDAKDFIVLTDLLTGEAQCQYAYRIEATGQVDEYDIPGSRTLQALYDMEGNLLEDWAPVIYQQGFGKYIIRKDALENMMMETPTYHEGYQSTLYDFATGETLIQDAGQCFALGDDKIVVTDYKDKVMGVLKADGTVHSGFPPPENYYSAFAAGNYFLASPNNHNEMYSDPDFDWKSFQDQTILVNDMLEPLMIKDWIGTAYGVAEDLFLVSEDQTAALVSPDGTVVHQFPQGVDLDYYDSEIALLREQLIAENDYSWSYKLVNMNDLALAEGFRELTPDYHQELDQPAQQFIGIRDDTVQLLGRDGKVLATTDIPGISSVYRAGESRYSFSQQIGSDFFAGGLLDGQLNIVVPAEKYNSVEQAHCWNGSDIVYLPYYQGTNYSDRSGFTDILDADGNVLIGNLSTVHDMGEDRLAVTKGLYTGLMDLEGNWIVKRSVFNGYTDD